MRVGPPGSAELVDAPLPEPGPDEVIVEVEWASICATDRKIVARGCDPPRVIGHEAAGRLADGTFVGVHPDVGCETCPACREGQTNRCRRRLSIGLDRNGGLADAVAVPRRHVISLDGIEPPVAALLEPLACCLHSISRLAPRRGETALVVGAGAMGILCTWALQSAGCTVAVSQRSPARRVLALELGADAAVGPDVDPAAVLGDAPSMAVVTAPGPEALAWALETVEQGARVHAFAGTTGGAAIDANVLHYRHLTVVGSTGSTVADYERGRDLVAAGEIKLQRLPRAVVALDEAPAALTGAPQPGVLKVLIDLGCSRP